MAHDDSRARAQSLKAKTAESTNYALKSQAMVKAFLAENPKLIGGVFLAMTDDGQYVISAHGAAGKRFTSSTVQDLCCEGIAWNRALARDVEAQRTAPTPTNDAPARRQ